MMFQAARLTENYLKRTTDLLEGPDAAPVARTPKETVARLGRASLTRYRSPARNRKGTPVLLVYALINKPAILDLMPGRSVVETLLGEGLDVFLLDWGTPASEHAREGLEAHVLGTLDRAVEGVLKAAASRKAALVGYCMGGTLSVLYAALRPAKVERLFVMAAPIAGRIKEGVLHAFSHPRLFEPKLMSGSGLVPAEAMMLGFAALRPVENYFGKFVRFFEHGGDPAYRAAFLAMERWVREGVPLPGAIYEEFVRGIYMDDALRNGGLRVGRELADPKNVRCPLGLLVAEKDHLVPAASTLALKDLAGSRSVRVFHFGGGHVGLAASTTAHAVLWPEIASWLKGPRKRRAR